MSTYTVLGDDGRHEIEVDAERRRQDQRTESDHQRTKVAQSLRHAIDALYEVDLTTWVARGHGALEEELRDALQITVGTRE